MQVRTIIQEIQRLPLNKRFLVMEQTLTSIKQEELKQQLNDPLKQDIISNLKKGFEEMKLIKKRKLKTSSLADFLNEL